MEVVRGARGEEVASEGGRRVVALAGNDHRPIAPAHDHRLVAGGVPRCRYDEHVPQDFGLAVEDLIGQPRGIDKLGQRVVRSPLLVDLDNGSHLVHRKGFTGQHTLGTTVARWRARF